MAATSSASADTAKQRAPVRGGLKKQAVVVIHGMGEQRPMATLRGFVDAVWAQNHYLPEALKVRGVINFARPNRYWISPDPKTGSHEQRRITTPYDAKGRRTDFFEIYWADITQGTTRGRLYSWLSTLLLRSQADIPGDARRLYAATICFTALLVLAAVALSATFWQAGLSSSLAVAAIVGFSSFLFWALDQFVLPYFGDVASYVRAEAPTVEKRALVRERGLALLRKLSEDKAYDRIVLVSHSLGSIIAYDLLQLLWAETRPWGIDRAKESNLDIAFKAVEAYSRLPNETFPGWSRQRLSEFRKAQWTLYKELRSRRNNAGSAWKVSDFVTLGSPLTHAEFLTTHNSPEWQAGVVDRQFSICPPISDDLQNRELLFDTGRGNLFAAHHGATFAATRWTNIFDIGNYLATGDPISGAMWENFGPGVDNVQVELKWRVFGKLRRLFTHTKYWALDVSGAVVVPIGKPPSGGGGGPVGSTMGGAAFPGGGGGSPAGTGAGGSSPAGNDDLPPPYGKRQPPKVKRLSEVNGEELLTVWFGPTAHAAVPPPDPDRTELAPPPEHIRAVQLAVDLQRREGDDGDRFDPDL